MRLAFALAGRLGGFALAARAELELDGVTALFGPSGAGKSTILQALAGFRPDLGRVSVDGAVWQDPAAGARPIPPHRRPVGLVFQDGRLFPHLSVEGNLRFAERRADPAGPPIRRAELIDALGLAPLLARGVAGLSGGETQRAAIGRALLSRPRLLLMDEPLAALDRARKARILPLIAELPDRFGVRVVYVSHLIEEVARIAPTMIALSEGRVVAAGATAAALDALDPAVTGRFEAGALLTGVIVAKDAALQGTEVEIGGARLWAPGIAAAPVGASLGLRVRARDVSVSRGRPSEISIQNILPVVLDHIEIEDGPFAELRLRCAGQPLTARITRRALAALALAPGDPLFALIKAAAFDRRLDAPAASEDAM